MNEREIIYNYKEALNSPQMIQKITKNFSFENPIPLSKFVVFFLGVLGCFTVFKPIFFVASFVPGVNYALYVLIPVGMVYLWENVEPDGLKIHQFLLDYFTYWLTYRLGRKVIVQGEPVTREPDIVVFEQVE